MNTSEVETLQARLTAMERRFRAVAAAWLTGAVLAGVLGIGVQRATSQQSSMTTREIHIIDQAGKERIAMGISARGNPAMWFYDAAGKTRIYLGLATGSSAPTPQVVLQDEREQVRLYMGWSDTTPDLPLIFVNDKSGKELWRAP